MNVNLPRHDENVSGRNANELSDGFAGKLINTSVPGIEEGEKE